MELLLIQDDLLDVAVSPPPEQITSEWTNKDMRARAKIGLSVADNQLSHIRKIETAYGQWEALRNYHERASFTNKILLLKKLCSAKLSPKGNMSDHLNGITLLVDRLSALGEDLTEHLVIAMILSSLPDSYNGLITALENRPEEELQLEFVKGKLLDEWRRRCDSDGKSGGARASTSASGGIEVAKEARPAANRPRNNANKNNVVVVNANTNNKRNVGRKVVCYYCKAEGHTKNDCWQLQDKQKRETATTQNCKTS